MLTVTRVPATYIRLFGAFVLWICVLFQRDFYKPDRHQRVRNTWVTFWLTDPISSFWNVWLWKKNQEILSNRQNFTNLPSNLFPLGHTLCFAFWRINGETRWFGDWGLHKARGDHGDFTFQWLRSYVPAWCLHTTPKATSITFRWQVWSSPRLTESCTMPMTPWDTLQDPRTSKHDLHVITLVRLSTVQEPSSHLFLQWHPVLHTH